MIKILIDSLKKKETYNILGLTSILKLMFDVEQ